jgi:hypothetical protein
VAVYPSSSKHGALYQAAFDLHTGALLLEDMHGQRCCFACRRINKPDGDFIERSTLQVGMT